MQILSEVLGRVMLSVERTQGHIVKYGRYIFDYFCSATFYNAHTTSIITKG